MSKATKTSMCTAYLGETGVSFLFKRDMMSALYMYCLI